MKAGLTPRNALILGIVWLLIIIAGISMSSCSTVHKILTSSKKTSDSAVVTRKDSTTVSRQDATTDNLSVKDIDVTVYYDSTPAEKALAEARKKPVDRTPMKPGMRKVDNYAELIKDAIGHTGSPGRITAVSIHIGSISDSSATTSREDSGSVKTATDSHVKTTDAEKTKTVVRTGLPWWIYAAGGAVLLIILIIAGVRIARKLHII